MFWITRITAFVHIEVFVLNVYYWAHGIIAGHHGIVAFIKYGGDNTGKGHVQHIRH